MVQQLKSFLFSRVLQIQLDFRRLAYLRDLLRVLVARDMKLRYKRSVMGFAWSLLNPVAQLLIFSFVFRSILPLNIPNYTSFLFIGLLSWSWFNSALFQSTEAIVGNRELIKRPGFPVEILPVITVTSHLVHFLLALPVLILFLTLNEIPMTSAYLFLPLLISLQFTLILSLAYVVAALHVEFRDTQYLLGIFLLLSFYLTPVFYDSSAISQSYQALYRLNPMVHLIEAYRSIMLFGNFPDIISMLVLSFLSAGLLYVGWRIFVWSSYHFVDEI